MRIFFLNCWRGKIDEAFLAFVQKYSPNTDVFCFQEFYSDLFSRFQKILKNHHGIYESGGIYKGDGLEYGQAIFVKKEIDIILSKKVSIVEDSMEWPGFLLYTRLDCKGKKLSLGNIHGISPPGNKLDTDVRLKQSEKIINFFADKDKPKIVGGDFNLLPNTESVSMFEKAGYRNLIKDFDIKNTRNKLSWEQFNRQPDFVKQYFADYVFVSPEIKVKKFDVPYMEISDHLPLILDFEV